MAKRRPSRVSKPTRSSSPLRRRRRSPRLQEIAQKAAGQSSRQLLPSPPPSRLLQPLPLSKKRRYDDSVGSAQEKNEHPPAQRRTLPNHPEPALSSGGSDPVAHWAAHEHPAKRRTLPDHPEPAAAALSSSSSSSGSDPVAHWAAHEHYWPKNWPKYRPHQELGEMSQPTSPNKRKSSSTHYTVRRRLMEQNGVHMQMSAQLQQSSKDLCSSLLEGDRKPGHFPYYPAAKVSAVLHRVQMLNEARLQRDVTPWIVPSPENLFFSDELTEDYIGEEVQAEWYLSEPMGGPKPKPDLTVGLKREAFRDDEWAKLENHTTSRLHFHFTPNLWFPFLICEVKTGLTGLDTADVQNIHSGSIAVRSIVRLHIAAYGQHDPKVADLSGRVLAFTASHNNQMVKLYAHFAVAKDGGHDKDEEAFEYFRYGIAMFSLEMSDGKERYKAYNFVRNVYDKFAPEHRQRIRDAINMFDEPPPRTGQSFATASLGLTGDGRSQSDQTPSQEDGAFKMPGEPASAATMREMSRVLEQFEQQKKESKEQLEQQRKESRDKEERMERQMEQQRMESREQLEQQRKESRDKEERMERQMEQLMKMVSELSEAKATTSV